MPVVGALRHEIELIYVGLVEKPSGGFDRADAVDTTVDGAVRPASWSDQDRHGFGRREQRLSLIVTIRWDPDLAVMITPQSRARFTDAAGRKRELSVNTVVDPDERGRWLELGCTEGGPK